MNIPAKRVFNLPPQVSPDMMEGMCPIRVAILAVREQGGPGHDRKTTTHCTHAVN